MFFTAAIDSIVGTCDLQRLHYIWEPLRLSGLQHLSVRSLVVRTHFEVPGGQSRFWMFLALPLAGSPCPCLMLFEKRVEAFLLFYEVLS